MICVFFVENNSMIYKLCFFFVPKNTMAKRKQVEDEEELTLDVTLDQNLRIAFQGKLDFSSRV